MKTLEANITSTASANNEVNVVKSQNQVNSPTITQEGTPVNVSCYSFSNYMNNNQF